MKNRIDNKNWEKLRRVEVLIQQIQKEKNILAEFYKEMRMEYEGKFMTGIFFKKLCDAVNIYDYNPPSDYIVRLSNIYLIKPEIVQEILEKQINDTIKEKETELNKLLKEIKTDEDI